MVGGFGIIQIKGVVFGDDLFELRFDARGILLVGEFNEFPDLLIYPVGYASEPVMESAQRPLH